MRKLCWDLLFTLVEHGRIFLDLCPTSPTFALLSEYSCGLNVGFQSLVFARTPSVAGLVRQVALLGTQAQPPLLNSIRSHKPGSLPPLGVGPRLWTSVFSWLGWEPGLCQPAVTILKNYFALRCFSCHFSKAPSAPPGDHYFPSLNISWDGLWIQPVHLLFSVLLQVERWNYSPLVLWPTVFKTKIWSYPALFVLWLLELFCFALFYLNLCFFHSLSVKGGRPHDPTSHNDLFSISPQKSHTRLHQSGSTDLVKFKWRLKLPCQTFIHYCCYDYKRM